ncbi:MAG: GH3 auxin-responsive promoter family protein [Bacteroidales bacterium]|nr:GH3 auxin-responsive promoter family protein [Bacteroidales bacterium]HPO64726.1 GH3 auxin-responsive promoter family protein [Bacteroidales bacterium]
MTIPFERLFLKLNQYRLRAIEKYDERGWEIQEKTLHQLLHTAQHTQYGNQYQFKHIRSYTDFQQRVPLVHYEELHPWIEKIRHGEKNVLWPGKIFWMARSSGTTNDKSKFIPVTAEALNRCHYRGGADVLLLYFRNNTSSKLFSGKTFTLGGSHQIDHAGHKVRCGDLSAILLQNIPRWANYFRTPPRKIALIADWEIKIARMLPIVARQNVTGFAGVPSWNLVFLQKLLAYTGKTNILEIWPNLELFMHGGVNFEPYREQFRQIIPSDKMHYLETYNASEGFFGIQDDPTDSGLLLMLDYGIFYEFIAMDDYQKGYLHAIPLADVKPHVNYVVVISTNGGLWRYIIGDTVMFTAVKPYKIIITGRTKHYLNVFGEELMVHNTDTAIAYAAAHTQSIVYEYTVAPVFMSNNNKGCHEWLIEFEKHPEDIAKFRVLLDNKLKELNSDYEAKRYKDTTLTEPIIRILPRGTFHKWFVSHNKVGGQNKLPRLSNNRRYVEELLTLMKESI